MKIFDTLRLRQKPSILQCAPGPNTFHMVDICWFCLAHIHSHPSGKSTLIFPVGKGSCFHLRFTGEHTHLAKKSVLFHPIPASGHSDLLRNQNNTQTDPMTVKSRTLVRNIVDRFSLSTEIVKLLTCDSRPPNSLYYCLEGKACLRMKPTQRKIEPTDRE